MSDSHQNQTDSVPVDQRDVYEPPCLREIGSLVDVTQSNGNDNGPDAAYS